MSNLEEIKILRERTGVSFMQCRKALEEAGGDKEKALGVLREKGAEIASKKKDRILGAGVIASYIHSDNKLGVLVEVLCETDFVARNSDFRELTQDVAMHIAAMNPEYIRNEDIPDEEKEHIRLKCEGDEEAAKKPKEIRDKIISGKIDSHLKEKVLLSQPFIKNSTITVSERVEEAIQKLGEKIEISRFKRFALLKE